MCFSFTMLVPSCFLLGLLFLHLVLQLVYPWSFLTMLIVCIFPIFSELFLHFLNFVLFCSFVFVVLQCWILFFFAWCIVVALGVATCAPMIISNIVYCLNFCNFSGFFSSFFGLCFASRLLLPHDVHYGFFCQLAHCFCIGVVTSTLVIITNNACCQLLSNL